MIISCRELGLYTTRIRLDEAYDWHASLGCLTQLTALELDDTLPVTCSRPILSLTGLQCLWIHLDDELADDSLCQALLSKRLTELRIFAGSRSRELGVSCQALPAVSTLFHSFLSCARL